MSKKDAGWLGASDANRGLGARSTQGWHHQAANKYNSGYAGTKK